MHFIDLSAQQNRIRDKVDQRITKVLDHGAYIMGPEVAEIEGKLAEFCGAKYVLSCSNGTDALLLGLMAKGIGAGDAVIVPSMTFAATAESVARLGATPVFADIVEDTYNLDPESVKEAIVAISANDSLTLKGIIPVGLFGQPSEMDAINLIAKDHGIWVMDDAAQSFGATYKDARAGNLADITTTSFFPAKPLGCYGDGGAVFTNDLDVYNILKSLRVHGQGSHKYENVRLGMTGRLDTIQAAILLEKIAIFQEEIDMRQKVAARYNDALKNHVKTPVVIDETISTWAQYTIRIPEALRDDMADALKGKGIPTCIYYPNPLHKQKAYSDFPVVSGGLPVTEMVCKEVISLPMHPYLDSDTQDQIISAVIEFIETARLKAA